MNPPLTRFGIALFDVAFGCRPDQGRDTCRNSANASIVSLRLHCQKRFYLRPKFRQLQRLLGPAYPKNAINLDPVPRSRVGLPFLQASQLETMSCPTAIFPSFHDGISIVYNLGHDNCDEKPLGFRLAIPEQVFRS